MEQNNLFHDRYFLERLLGRGNFSEVWLAKDTKTDIKVALKVYAPATGLDDAGLNVFAREFSLVVNANHKNLLKPLYYDSCDRKPYLVLPYCEKGSIMKLVGKFSEQDAWRLLRDVASGLAWLHAMNPPVIHQDIKPDNIMVADNGDFMITDFGVSTHLRSTLRKSLSSAFSSAGTVAYMAPERFGKDNTPIMANDIYSLGATVFEMLSGDTPFGDDGGLVQKKGAEIPELKGDYSPQLKKLIYKCLSTDPWKRPTAEQLEQYAITGLSGNTIKYADEKTAWQKHKLLFSVVGGVLVVAIIGGGMLIKHQVNVKRETREKMAIMAHNDSVQAEVSQLVFSADSLVQVGDLHDEGYERAYLKAYDNYESAEELAQTLQDSANVDRHKNLDDKKSLLERKLYDAYVSFQEKSQLFKDDVEISTEFKERAGNISFVINVAEFENKQEKAVPEE
ncbi:MAG TPA: serine/threonine-protein kinase [Bacteroidaceae bacterium]|nr:serine/threonine-protein kinase [Bacteroidaceae bacterium]